jgi:RNA polymerase sigma factor (TIGR02999 family)
VRLTGEPKKFPVILNAKQPLGGTVMSTPTTQVRTSQVSAPNAVLLQQLYDELRLLAAAKLRREAAVQTLQPTALVHEAWLRLGGDRQPLWQNDAHFFGAAAEAMRRILIERARHRQAIRHGGGQQCVEIQEVDLEIPPQEDDRLLAVNEALDWLAAEDHDCAELVKLHYFAGLTMTEAARALGISEPTAYRWWAYARAWLFKEINETPGK